MHNQLQELTTNYGQVDLIWFDAIKPSQVLERGMKALWIQQRTLDMIRENQPGILINDRTGFRPDFITNENRDSRYVPGLVMESCVKLGNPYWAWSPDITSKSLSWLMDRLIINVCNNSNLLLNVGPDPNGEIPQILQEKLTEAGKWLNRHQEAFYGTRGGPFFGQEWGSSTYRDNKVYLFLNDTEADELVLPFMNQNVLSAHHFPEMKEIPFDQDRTGIRLKIPDYLKEATRPVVVVEFSSSLEATNSNKSQ
jgi:alpha-L-fucosidase